MATEPEQQLVVGALQGSAGILYRTNGVRERVSALPNEAIITVCYMEALRVVAAWQAEQ